MSRFKAPTVPDGHSPRGTTGKVVNMGESARDWAQRETARQRHLWNWFLNLQHCWYDQTDRFMFYNEMASVLTDLRRTDTHFSIGSCALQQATLRSLDRALRDSFASDKARKRFPRFKVAWPRASATSLPVNS